MAVAIPLDPKTHPKPTIKLIRKIRDIFFPLQSKDIVSEANGWQRDVLIVATSLAAGTRNSVKPISDSSR